MLGTQRSLGGESNRNKEKNTRWRTNALGVAQEFEVCHNNTSCHEDEREPVKPTLQTIPHALALWYPRYPHFIGFFFATPSALRNLQLQASGSWLISFLAMGLHKMDVQNQVQG